MRGLWVSLALVLCAPSLADSPLDFSRSPGALVLRLTQWSPEAEGSTPLVVSVYGDGRVHVQPPAHHGRADAEHTLDAGRLQALVARQVALGVADFDPKAVRARVRQRERETGILHGTGDADITTLEVNVVRGGAAVSRRVAWKALRADARAYPEIPELARLAEAADALGALARETGP